MNILLVDGEREIADLIELYLVNEGHTVHKFYDGSEALEFSRKGGIDLAVLDVMLPGTDGFAMVRKIREDHNYPIIMLTAKIDDIDKITGLTLGADDYITKPFNPLELVARVKAQLRRTNVYGSGGSSADNTNESIVGDSSTAGNNYINFAGLEINRDTHECTLYEKSLNLTPTEFDILWLLCENRGKVISAEELFERVWGEKYLDNNNTVMVHIRRLREKMNDPKGDSGFIKTVWGVGYKVDR